MSNRSQNYVDPEVQGALARRLVVHWAFFIVLSTTLAIGLHWLSDPFTSFWDHTTAACWTYGPAFLVLLCLAPVFIYDAIKLSNRFTGPTLRLRQAIRQLADGDSVEKVKLRDNDFWHEVAEDLNRVIDRVQAPVVTADE